MDLSQLVKKKCLVILQEGMFDQIKSIANEVLGNVTIQIVVPSSSDGYSEQVMFAQEYDYYNRISSKYLIVK